MSRLYVRNQPNFSQPKAIPFNPYVIALIVLGLVVLLIAVYFGVSSLSRPRLSPPPVTQHAQGTTPAPTPDTD
jgi:hypothetical protein